MNQSGWMFGGCCMAAVGFFDSGVGGVTVMKEARRILPREDFLFYGDTLHAPYGDRPVEEIRILTGIGVEYLLNRGCKALVIACNTATAAAAAQLRKQLSIPIIAIEPALKPAQETRRGGSVLVLATRATLQLEKFRRLMERYGEGVIAIPGTGLVELIEAGKANSPECEELLRALLQPHLQTPVDAIVLGCTHYVFLRPVLARLVPRAAILDGHRGTARQLARVLREAGLLEDGRGTTVFYSTAGRKAQQVMEWMYRDLPLEEPDQI